MCVCVCVCACVCVCVCVCACVCVCVCVCVRCVCVYVCGYARVRMCACVLLLCSMKLTNARTQTQTQTQTQHEPFAIPPRVFVVVRVRVFVAPSSLVVCSRVCVRNTHNTGYTVPQQNTIPHSVVSKHNTVHCSKARYNTRTR